MPTAMPALVELGQGLRSWRDRVARAAVDLDISRQQICRSIADLQSRRHALRLATSDRELRTQQRDDASDAGVFGVVLGAILPIGGDVLAREAKSELTYGQTSEQVVAEADARLAEITEVDVEITRTQQNNDTATRHLATMEDLDNSLSVLSAELADEEQISSHVTGRTWPLYQVTVQAGTRSLLDTLGRMS